MTNREFYATIASIESLSSELRDFANEAIAKMDAKNASRSSKPSKTAEANCKLAEEMLLKLEAGKTYSASDLATLMDFRTEAGAPSPSKATAVVKILVESGKVTVSEIKVPKKGKCKGYALAQDVTVE